MKFSTSFSFSKVAVDQSNVVHLLLSATAPKLDISGKRKPLNIIVALDASTSMGGDKIDYVRKSASKLVEHLTPDDRLGVIVFDSQIRTLFEPMLMTPGNKGRATAAIAAIHSQGCTNFSGVMLEGFKQSSIDKDPVRFIILTDGQPTAGETNKEALLAIAKRSCGENVSITTFGYGNDHDPEFLTTLATSNRGNYAFIKNPDDALTGFARELGGLLSCYAQGLKFKVTPKTGVEILKVVSDVDVEQLEGGAVEISVADLYSEEPRNIVLEVRLPKQSSALPRPVTLLDVNLSYTETQTGESKSFGAKAKVSFVKRGEADKQPNKEVMEHVTLAQLMEAQKEATRAAKRGDFGTAQSVLRGVNMDYANPHALSYMDLAVNAYSDVGTYTTNSAVLSSTASAFKTGKFSGGIQGMGMSNSTQDAVIQSFTGDLSQTSGSIQIDPKGNLTCVTTGTAPDTSKKTLSKTKSSSDW